MDTALLELLRASRSNAEVARRLGVSRERARQLRDAARMPPRRQARYTEIVRLLGEGKSPAEIARALGVRSIAGSLAVMRQRGILGQAETAERECNGPIPAHSCRARLRSHSEE